MEELCRLHYANFGGEISALLALLCNGLGAAVKLRLSLILRACNARPYSSSIDPSFWQVCPLSIVKELSQLCD